MRAETHGKGLASKRGLICNLINLSGEEGSTVNFKCMKKESPFV